MKLIRVTATNFETYEHFVEVEDHVSENDVLKHYEKVGANGEFEKVDDDWEWGDVELLTTLPANTEAEKIDLGE